MLFIFALFTACCGIAQVRMNNAPDPADTELNNALKFINSYFNEFYGRHLPDFTRYWPGADCRENHYPDKLLYGVNTDLPTYQLGKPMILQAKPENGKVHIKTMFYNIDSAGRLLVLSITNHYIRQAAGHLYFEDPMAATTGNWQTYAAGDITYSYPAYHKLDKNRVRDMAARVRDLRQEWDLPPLSIRYYFADTRQETDMHRGFDYTITMDNRDKPGGMSDGVDNIIYCGGLGEDYFHEVVHLYLNRLHPQSPLNEGLAVMYGGSLGRDLPWHLRRMNAYLHQHPELDLNHPEKWYYLDNNTNPYSAILGMLCQLIYEKDGVAGLRRALACSTLNEIMDKEFKVENGGWDAWLRQMIDKGGQ